jgi:anti-sigma B factor antagonist
MEIITLPQPGRVPATVLQLKGDLDASTEQQVVESARAAVAQGTRNVVIDLAGVAYMSSAGVRALHQVYLLLRPAGEEQAALQGMRDGSYTASTLKLLRPNKDVQSVLSMTGMDMYLEIHPDLKSALAAFGPG